MQKLEIKFVPTNKIIIPKAQVGEVREQANRGWDSSLIYKPSVLVNGPSPADESKFAKITDLQCVCVHIQ